MPQPRELTCEEILWLLGSLSSVFRIPFDAALVAQEHPPPHTVETLHEAARALGLKTGTAGIGMLGRKGVALPVVAFLRPACATQPEHVPASSEAALAKTASDGIRKAPGTRAPSAVLIVRVEADRLAYFRAGSQTPETLRTSEAPSRLEPEVILVAKDSAAYARDECPGFASQRKAFGFRWFIPELLKHRRIWRDVLLASLAIQLAALAVPLFTQVIIDKVIVHQTHSTLVVLGVALFMFMLFTSAMTWLRQYLVLHTGNRIDAVLGSQVFRHLLRLPLPYFEQRPTGTLVARLHGVETIREFVSGAAIALVLDLPFLIVFLVVMFAYSWQLSLVAVVLLGMIAIISLAVAPVFRARLDRQFMLGARNQSFLTEYVCGMATVKSLQMESDLDRRYGDLLAQYLGAGFATRQAGNTYSVVANGLEQAMTLAILIAGALLVMRNDGFTVGMLVAFQMFAGRMSQPLLRLVGLWQEFQQAAIAVKRIGDIVDMPQESHALTPSRESAQNGLGRGRIGIHDLAFRYSDHHPWLYRKLDLHFKPGRLSVIMGPSGCGKSTLAKLLLGFYLPVEGRIALDGRDIRHLAANELRSAFGMVPQDTVLFSGTLYDNLVMAHPHASFDDVIAACKAAEIHDTIEALPDGYQTHIGERGTGLSGGQKQRVAIARALLKRPQILVFDEATSNLDQATAEHFARTINNLKGRVTMIFITHQIPGALQVDEVFTFGGRAGVPKMEVVAEPEAKGGRWVS